MFWLGGVWLSHSLQSWGEQDAAHRTIGINQADLRLRAMPLVKLETLEIGRTTGVDSEAGGCRVH